MEKGWNAEGLLKPLWERLPGKRDELAARTGIGGNTLSAYNTGTRPLGIANARKIARALKVSLLELGAPEEVAAGDQRSRRPLDRLRALEAEHAELHRQFLSFVEATTARLVALEEAPAKRAQR